VSVYADKIATTADHRIRRARVNALFEGTRMAALMATAHHNGTHPAPTGAAMVPLAAREAT
jgi:hypothetical protein